MGYLRYCLLAVCDWLVCRCPVPRSDHLRCWWLRRRGAVVGPEVRIQIGSRMTGVEHLEIGAYTRIGANAVWTLGPGASTLRIGRDVLIGPDCYIRNASHRFRDSTLPIRDQGHLDRPIVVGDGAWIGARCLLLGGARLGDHAILGAGSVLDREIPAYGVAVGNRAQLQYYRDRWEHD